MQLKWLEDFIALAQERSFTRAAEIRHVTHPAFGRRIQALEAWAGTALVERSGGPVKLTPAGQAFLDTANQMVRSLAQSQEELQSVAGRQARTATIATGRTLARTVVADWLVQLQPLLQGSELCIRTRALADTVAMLERNEADFSLVYHHPALAIRLDARQFTHFTVASDKLVPVSRASAQGQARY
ncbi:MAG: LysR family transcriptional regulator, partial [Burkholderiaceae bacterium]|nr:LysR family transcriptional regulator [Burkholderiaceae bacterium]